MKKRILFLALLLWLGTPAHAEERVNLPELGFSVTAPDGWQRISGEQVFAHLRNIRLDREEFQRQLAEGSEPIVSLRKNASDRSGLIPILNIGFRPAGALAGQTPVQILDGTARVGRQAFNDFEILEGPTQVRVSGLPGAHVRVSYTQTQQGLRLPSISEYWIIPRGAYHFFISAGYAHGENDVTRREIQALVESITIDSGSR